MFSLSILFLQICDYVGNYYERFLRAWVFLVPPSGLSSVTPSTLATALSPLGFRARGFFVVAVASRRVPLVASGGVSGRRDRVGISGCRTEVEGGDGGVVGLCSGDWGGAATSGSPGVAIREVRDIKNRRVNDVPGSPHSSAINRASSVSSEGAISPSLVAFIA